jgi:hypothetical protein
MTQSKDFLGCNSRTEIAVSHYLVSVIQRAGIADSIKVWRRPSRKMVSIDFFTVLTSASKYLYVFLVAHDRRRILHFNVTAHPTAEWTGQQLREAFPFDQLLRYRDAIFGNEFREQVRDVGIHEVLSTPRSPGREPTWSG